MALIKVEKLTKRFGGITAVSNLDFSIEPGGIVSIIGPNGAGKTTLFNLLTGVYQPTDGRFLFEGVDVTGQSSHELAAIGLSRTFQNVQSFMNMSALENVMVPLELAGIAGAEGPARAMLERVGLADRTDHYPSQLSGGEQQRVALARAFANRPRILFADVPTGNLDAAASNRITDLLFELNADAGTTLVLVTHDAELAGRAGRVIRLRDGCMVDDETTRPSRPASAAGVEPA